MNRQSRHTLCQKVAAGGQIPAGPQKVYAAAFAFMPDAVFYKTANFAKKVTFRLEFP
jgi:hypothetical protein